MIGITQEQKLQWIQILTSSVSCVTLISSPAKESLRPTGT